MIVGITGAICAGKTPLAMYLVQTYGFEAVNLLDIFRSRVKQQLAKKEKTEEAIEASQQTEEQIENSDFCQAYYKRKYQELRKQIIKEVFRDLTGKWDRHFVVYPLSAAEDIQLML